MSSRARDQATLRRVIVMQRLHDLDLAGEMIREGGWEHLRLPMRFESNDRARTFVFMNGERIPFAEDPRTYDGELLDPARFPEHVVHELETDGMGPTVAAAQLQQRPTAAGGDIYRTTFFTKRWTKLPPRAVWLQSWDVRFKDESSSGDWVVGGVWCVEGANIYAVDQVRGRWSFLETLREVANLSARYPQARLKLIENKANGPAVVNVMKSKLQGLVLVEPQGGKIDRANGVTDLWEAGNVHLPAGNTPIMLATGEELEPSAPWVPGFVAEHLSFPRGAHDDQVDQANQALDRLRSYDYSGYAAGVEALNHALGI
jgi:predicted phage terminase large subunit-like protein